VYIKTKHTLQVNDAYCLSTFWNRMGIITWLHSISLFCRYGSGSGPIWLDNVGCAGSESCLLSCSNNGIGVHNCFHSEDVAISCSGTSFTSTDCSNTALPSKYSSVLIGVEVWHVGVSLHWTGLVDWTTGLTQTVKCQFPLFLELINKMVPPYKFMISQMPV